MAEETETKQTMTRAARYYMLHREERLAKRKEYYEKRPDVIQRREEKEKKRAEKEAEKEALKEHKRMAKEQKILERIEAAKATSKKKIEMTEAAELLRP